MKKFERFLPAAGFLVVCLSVIPCILLGKSAYITYHDQLDGEMVAYILQAKHLWQGGTLPEFLGGADKTALMLPAPACVLFFLAGNPFAAYVGMEFLGRVIAFWGMYLLVREITNQQMASVTAGVLYAWLPFLPVYGLSQFGLPMLLWCVLQLGKNRRKKVAFVYGVLYAWNSSLVLVGFAVLLALLCYALARSFLMRKKRAEERRGCLVRWSFLWLELAVVYLLTNLPLAGQLLGLGAKSASHKEEYVLSAENIWESWKNGLLYGGQHSGDYHAIFLWLVILAALFCAFDRKSAKNLKCLQAMAVSFGCNVCLAGVSALWNSGAGIAVRRHLGAVGAFQMDRLLWLAPCLWYLMLGCALAAFTDASDAEEKQADTSDADAFEKRKKYRKIFGLAGCIMSVAALGVTGFRILKDSDFKANVKKLIDPEYPVICYEDYYAIGILEQVEAFLADSDGRKKQDYRVVSLGIDPAAALYHGFYCLDGYSNNYSLEYKHQFREIIAPELEKNAYLKAYYDDWGNRCYLFSAECPAYYTIEKNGFYFKELSIDTKKLREMGGEYLFSAAYIANAKELGLELLREEPFEVTGSYYRIFLYRLNG